MDASVSDCFLLVGCLADLLVLVSQIRIFLSVMCSMSNTLSIRRRAGANHGSHRLNQEVSECSYVQKRLGNMPDHCTLEYKLAVDFSCQPISGSGGRYYFPLIFAHFFIKKSV